MNFFFLGRYPFRQTCFAQRQSPNYTSMTNALKTETTMSTPTATFAYLYVSEFRC